MLLTAWTAHAQADQPQVLILQAKGPITPPMAEYIGRGIEIAKRQSAAAVIIALDTPGGDLGSLDDIMQAIRASTVPVVVYVSPNGAMAGSAGALITMAGHVAAMAPESAIGASSPVGASGQELGTTEKTKAMEILKAKIRPLVERRGTAAVQLAESMIEEAKAVSSSEALGAHLIDMIATDTSDLLQQLDGFSATMPGGARTLNTAGAVTRPVEMTLIEQLLLVLTDPNIVFILLSVGVLALQVELTHPGAWVPGFVGVTCLALAIYGLGVLPVNWFGLVFIITAFVLFLLDIKAPTHGALTAAGVASFIVGTLVLFNSPGVPAFERVSVPLVFGVAISIGLMFAGILTYALRAQRLPVLSGVDAMVGRIGTAKSDIKPSGQVQVESELWTADMADGSASIRRGDKVEVVSVRGVRLKVRKT